MIRFKTTNGAPDCGNPPEICRITFISSVSTPIEWIPEYDGTGKQVNTNPNTFVVTATCSVCDGSWEQITHDNETELKQMAAPKSLNIINLRRN